jgi:hypothetical protein
MVEGNAVCDVWLIISTKKHITTKEKQLNSIGVERPSCCLARSKENVKQAPITVKGRKDRDAEQRLRNSSSIAIDRKQALL